jgi:hypothetical protein
MSEFAVCYFTTAQIACVRQDGAENHIPTELLFSGSTSMCHRVGWRTFSPTYWRFHVTHSDPNRAFVSVRLKNVSSDT